MTSIVVWAGVDQRNQSSINIASDSRITWSAGQQVRHGWDQARKVFASQNHPFIFGFDGDVLFPTLAIAAVVDRLDRGFFATQPMAAARQIEKAIKELWTDYPDAEQRSQRIYMAFRESSGMHAQFHLHKMHCSDQTGYRWQTSLISMPKSSSVLVIGGSGKSSVEKTQDLWRESSSAGTSRAVFASFAESIKSGSDKMTGGAPQLACIYRVDPARLVGLIFENERFLAGGRLVGHENTAGVEWRNELFERVGGLTKSLLDGAQKHEPRGNSPI